MKIAIIGAGSAIFSLNLIGDLCLTESLQGSTISLMDINERRLDAIYLLCRRYAEEMGRDFRIGEVPVRCPYGHTKSHIRLRDNLQLAKASFTCALALARMMR